MRFIAKYMDWAGCQHFDVEFDAEDIDAAKEYAESLENRREQLLSVALIP